MKKLIVPKLLIDASDMESVSRELTALPAIPLDTLNWADEFPAEINASFRIAHNGTYVLLRYDVHEYEILGLVSEDNGRVWTDSCAEFFISFDKEHYYNIESTCVGRVLMGYRRNGEHAKHAKPETMRSIKRLPSLGFANRERQSGSFDWSLVLAIPCTAFWESNIKTFDGLKASGNFYKCGDNLTHPHYVSWSKIDIPKPSFHQPGFFGSIEFAKDVKL
jgi:hypothetical protein